MGTRALVNGYEVRSSDDSKVGQVVDVEGDLLIVESGTLRKSKHAIPQTFAETDESEQVVRLTVTKELVADSPPIGDELDRDAVAVYYGLVGPTAHPDTQGYGDVLPDDPQRSAEAEGRTAGVEPPAEQRARMRDGDDETGVHGRQIIPPDAHDRV